MKLFFLSLFSPIILPINSWALTFTENFSSTTYLNTTTDTAVWNYSQGKVHPPLAVYNMNNGAAVPTRNISIGEGDLGSFDSSTYYLYDSDGNTSDNIITLNLDLYSSGLSFSNFVLDAGVTLRPTGSNNLVIYSLGDVLINGTIDCSGGTGADVDATDTTIGAGGTARCGSGAGGDGGSASVAATAGTSNSTGVTGGAIGATGASGGAGGGGGGAHNVAGANLSQAGEDPNAGGASDGGAAGTVNNTDTSFLLLEGGAGGAGGGVHDQGGADDSSGAGGGAGGGVVAIYAYQDILINGTGLVNVTGGVGGGLGAGTLDGGAGGGGGGGSVILLAGRTLENNVASGVMGLGGSGGTTTNVTNGGNNGGSGSQGRFWGTDAATGIGGTGSENVGNTLIATGDVLAQEGTFIVESNSIPLDSTKPTITSINVTAATTGANTYTLEMAYSEREDFDVTTWVTASSLIGQQIERYIKFKITLSNTDRTQTAVEVSQIQINYEGGAVTDFDFKGGCGSIKPGGSNNTLVWLLLLTPFFVWSYFKLRLRTILNS